MGETEKKRVSSNVAHTPKSRRRNNKSAVARSAASCLRSQFVQYTLRAARFVLCLYVLSTFTAKGFMQVGIGQDPKITLKLKDFPEGHTLKVKHRRRQYATSCKGYSAVEDPYFVDYGGRYCGNVRLEAKQQSQQQQPATDAVPINELHTVDLTHKVFHSEDQAKEYFWRFWGIHSHSVLPAAFFMPVADKMELVADEHRALYYNPGVLVHSAVDDTSQSAHLVYFYRIERTVVVLALSGYPKQPSPSINPELVARLSRIVNDRIAFPSPLSTIIRQASERVLTFARGLENGVASVVAATTRMVDLAEEERLRVHQRIVDELANARTHSNDDDSIVSTRDNDNDDSNNNNNNVVYSYGDDVEDGDDDGDDDDGTNLDVDFYDEFDLIGPADELSDEYIAGHTHTNTHVNEAPPPKLRRLARV